MAIVLHHHPYSRASTVIWMLEEVGIDYELRFVDIMKGEQKKPEFLALNPMGKIPTLVDGDTIVTEAAAIGLYLADRYAPGKLAPALDDPARGTYLRWSLFGPAVIEPGTIAKQNDWKFKSSQAGWGDYEAMMAAIESALGGGDYILGDKFSMVDILFGGTLRYMTTVKMLEARPSIVKYVERLNERPALKRSDAQNARILKEHGIGG